MNNYILDTEIQDFINRNINSDIHKILLNGTSFKHVSTKELIEQIEAKKRCQKKLPSWFQTDIIYYPNKLNIEQTSSEITAKFKSQLISGNTLIDLTGGFGVDSFYFAKHFNQVVHCEMNSALSEIAHYNFKQLKAHNIVSIPENGLGYLEKSSLKYDWIYIDPSRRNVSKEKVFFLKDCLPNVPNHLEVLFRASKNILIKTSPLLDISAGIEELQFVKQISIVAVNNEVKELLWVLEKGFTGGIAIEAINIKNKSQEYFEFNLGDSQNTVMLNKPLSYLYEPNAAILKSGGFNEVSTQLKLFKLHANSHLYTSDELLDFPGRSFKIKQVIRYIKKELKKLNISKANITTRNFPETVQQIRKKLKITDGGDTYLFFTTDIDNERIVILSSKIC